MGIWDSLCSFSARRGSKRRKDSTKNPGRRSRALKPRDLRLEQFEDRVLLSISPGGTVVAADLPVGEVAFVMAEPHPTLDPVRVTHNVAAADTTNADQLQQGGSLALDLEGSGYTVGVWDGGLIRSTHQEFGGRVTLVDSGSAADHATHVGGTIGAAGVDPAARGMATQVSLRSYDWDNDLSEMAADSSLISASNHSYGFGNGWSVDLAANWGVSTSSGLVDVWFGDRALYGVEPSGFGKYDSSAEGLDQVLYSDPNLLSVWSSGNDRNDAYGNYSTDGVYMAWLSSDPGIAGFTTAGWYLVPDAGTTSAPGGDGNNGTGFDTLSQTQTAKNSLVVGAVEDLTIDPYTGADIAMSSFSSYGPTDDGRIKPDVVGNGVQLYSSLAGSDSDYDSWDGTSMAAPNVTGTSVLVMEHFENEFGFAPLAATSKGLLIHTARDGGNVGPDYSFGWGLVDAADAADFITTAASGVSTHMVHEETYTGTEWTATIDSSGTAPLRVSLVWTDPAGTAQPAGLDVTGSVLVNDLDLWVTGPGGTFYPWTLDPSNPATPAVRTAANHIDNVEQV
ncbi:MAG: S8 family serine peptidase, partial [Planctomycetes bacterium]|nr:S8 family serine peptidase [Planctomycetota bacterium]